MMKSNLIRFLVLLLFLPLFQICKGQETYNKNCYLVHKNIFGIELNPRSKMKRKYVRMLLFDSTYVIEKNINNFLPESIIIEEGRYIVDSEKMILIKSNNSKKTLKIKDNYLLKNRMFGIVKVKYKLVSKNGKPILRKPR